MALKVYNTLSRKKEVFEPLEAGKVKMYCCGPTVYDYLHVGNFRGAVVYNLLRNWLERLGYQVTFVYNFTDVDDKIIQRANEHKCQSHEISERYIQEFLNDFNTLKLRRHDQNPKVTEHMDDIVQVIERLIEQGRAYVAEGEVFYSIKTFSEYGKLSGRNTEELRAGSRVDIDPKKKDPMDFTLWKPSKESEPGWDSPWGKGRPGWHIECTAMIFALLGDQIDIHGGGLDLTFPHHENEIAQAEGATGKPYVKYWMHNNMFTFGGQKMSKSLGNVRTMRAFLESYHPEIFKYMVCSVHYRSQSDFTEDTIQLAVRALARVYSALAVAETYLVGQSEIDGGDAKMSAQIEQAQKQIQESLNDDLNTPVAFAALFDVVRFFNSQVKRGMVANEAVRKKAKDFKDFVVRFGSLMSLFQEEPLSFLKDLDDMLLSQMNLSRSEIDKLVSERTQARQNKDFKRSDELRDKLAEMGIEISDSPQGTSWEVKK